MLIVGDFNLNPMQGYSNSLKDVLKQTMLSQEVIFRKQVQELHRLYRIQKTLMEDSGWKELDEFNFWKLSTQSTLQPFTNPIQYSPLAKERTFSGSHMVGSTQSVNKDFLEGNHNDCSSFQKRPFDLQLPADQHVNRVCNGFLEKGNSWDLGEFIELKHRFHDDNVSSLEEVKLTLSIGGDTRKKGNCKKYWYDKVTHSSSHHVIDLEESTDTVSNEDAKSASTLSFAAVIAGDNKHDLRAPVQSNRVSRNSVKKDLSHGLTVSYTLVDGNESCEEQNSFNQGFKERHGDIACNDIFTKGKSFNSYEAVGLDLNKVQLDDSSYLNDPVVACVSTAGSSGAFDGLMGKSYEGCPAATSWRKPNVNCFNEPSTVLQQDYVANTTSMDPDSNNISSKIWASSAASEGISRSETCPIDLESMSGPLSDICEDLNSGQRNSGIGNVDLMLKFPKGNYTDVTMAEVIETREEDIAFSGVEDANSNKCPTSCKFDCSADDSSSGAKTMQSGTDLEGSNTSFNQFPKSESSQVAQTRSGEQDLRSSDSSEMKHQCCNKKEEESAGGDVLIQLAAESLIHFSLVSSTSNQYCHAKAGSNENENKGMDYRPQCSLDSYESMVLKLTESSVDDYCVSSKPLEVNEADKKDSGIKLRRGRRMKDFQRDVLPGLASLSRHEISEDIHIMEAAIRSREYKRMRSKMGGGGNWFAPAKSRRSRLSYVGRRYYS